MPSHSRKSPPTLAPAPSSCSHLHDAGAQHASGGICHPAHLPTGSVGWVSTLSAVVPTNPNSSVHYANPSLTPIVRDLYEFVKEGFWGFRSGRYRSPVVSPPASGKGIPQNGIQKGPRSSLRETPWLPVTQFPKHPAFSKRPLGLSSPIRGTQTWCGLCVCGGGGQALLIEDP
jgi:hypothetical protein